MIFTFRIQSHFSQQCRIIHIAGTHVRDPYGQGLFKSKGSITLKTENSASSTVESVHTYVYIAVSLFLFKCYFQLQFILSIILHWFQVDAQWLDNRTLHKVLPRYFQCPPGTIHSYCVIMDYIPYAVLHIPMTVL